MEPSPELQRALREIREHMLRSRDFPVPEEERGTLAEYELRPARPDQEAVSIEVDVRVRAEDASGPRRRRREVEITPQVMVESPGGLRFFAGWNDVGRVFVVWFTDESLDAIGERLDEEIEFP